MKPAGMPIGLLLTQTSKRVSRAFDDALAAGDGSLAVWLIFLALVREGPLSHAELASRAAPIAEDALQRNRRRVIVRLTTTLRVQ